MGAIVLTTDKVAIDLVGEESEDVPGRFFDEEMVPHIDGYVEYVNNIQGERYVETTVDYSHWAPEGYGTSDVIIADDDNSTLHVVDLKYGQGILVSPVENTQAMLYALGAYCEFDFIHAFENIVIHIYQPRMKNIEEWSITTKELLTWADEVVRPAAEATLDPDAPRIPGSKQCQWCQDKHACKELRDHTEKVIGAHFDDLTLPQVSDNLDLANVLKNKGLIEGWLKAIEKHVKDKLDNGEKFEGFKLVEGRGSRDWLNEDDVVTYLKNKKYKMDEIYTKKVISAPQAEKLLGKKYHKIEYLVERNPGKPTLAPESDRRPDISESILDEFEDLEDIF